MTTFKMPSTLLLMLTISCVQADITLVASTPAHQGSVVLTGENETCKTTVEAALRCDMAADGCAGVWINDNGPVILCQPATCPLDPSRINPISEQAGFYFVFMNTFTKGDNGLCSPDHLCLHFQFYIKTNTVFFCRFRFTFTIAWIYHLFTANVHKSYYLGIGNEEIKEQCVMRFNYKISRKTKLSIILIVFMCTLHSRESFRITVWLFFSIRLQLLL